jgi:hypothetical protein
LLPLRRACAIEWIVVLRVLLLLRVIASEVPGFGTLLRSWGPNMIWTDTDPRKSTGGRVVPRDRRSGVRDCPVRAGDCEGPSSHVPPGARPFSFRWRHG